jgi:hypothetical protein
MVDAVTRAASSSGRGDSRERLARGDKATGSEYASRHAGATQ